MRMIRVIQAAVTLLLLPLSGVATACGGFFCQSAPIVQAGEQIVFSQQGNNISAMVRILYQGSAEEFSWVVPVPDSLTLDGVDVGADITFDQLDIATQPRFTLQQTGEGCPIDFTDGGSDGGVLESAADSSTGGSVEVEESEVGPFDVQLISSDDPTAMVTWLEDNNYQLAERGEELITPYVQEGMNFVGLKLRSGQTTGSIQPIILRYQSDQPMIPIRLTAVAAMQDMGVLVWVVGDARAVPDNYVHVIPNYTRLNWYNGSQNAYASYQALITQAMNDADPNGQGFATDMAAAIDSQLLSNLTTADGLQQQLTDLDATATDAGYIAALASSAQSGGFQQALEQALPLQQGQNRFIYQDPVALTTLYNSETLAVARSSLRQSFVELEINPLSASTALLTEGAYLTRLFTTLSADEMTRDPTFAFNTSMPDQPIERQATLAASCGDNGTEWRLTLGPGTGRDGEVVVEANLQVPTFAVPADITAQASTFTVQRTTASAPPEVTVQNDFTLLEINGGVSESGLGAQPGANSTGGGGGGALAVAIPMLALLGWRRRSVR